MKQRDIVVGWREWVRLPDLGIRLVKAKVDTGARTSAIHADDLTFTKRRGITIVNFVVYPKQRTSKGAIRCSTPVIDERAIRSSNGQTEIRPVIETTLDVGGSEWPIELTLTSRDVMGFRMLLGRQAIRRHALVDPGRSYLTRKVKIKKVKKTKPVAKKTAKKR